MSNTNERERERERERDGGGGGGGTYKHIENTNRRIPTSHPGNVISPKISIIPNLK